jgi:5-dehydro-2-deoxygluconokinase
VAAKCDAVRGFAVGRTIFAETAERWFRNELNDEEAVANLASRFQQLVQAWHEQVAGVEPVREIAK